MEELREIVTFTFRSRYATPMKPNQFNIRVYGLLIHDERLLVTDEFRLGTCMTKFPGGALEFGEGTIECLKREFMEELETPILVTSHFYTTDYFQPSALLPSTMQLISIYYKVMTKSPFLFQTTDRLFDFPALVEGSQTFRWVPLASLTKSDLTFPIDQKVAGMLLQHTQHETTNS